ncbi:leucyl/phenylalanyl-tRNA--protein transferase [Ochrovirga pacifica]|uniref:leucyl/phenylalanyl-tRNA--protein transferase n=1 Tax=Ochrovirga pacifica TaxID=1042376 RepID=UPI000255A7C8|nr:leucyl/phenylalanyl-tRNA--protein transferase [Ochrovirga pacifica]
MYFLDPNSYQFPDPRLANADDILAIGGDLSPKRLIHAYQHGIFPWFNEGDPIIWYSPAWRMVLDPRHYKPSKSLQQLIKKNHFHITYNQHFKEVITQCKTISRNDGLGTWITDDMLQSYLKLHQLGHAKSVEVWQENKLVGGLYGVDLGHIFCGESMFSHVSNASKIAFNWLNNYLITKKYDLLDCQVHNSHLESLGAYEIPREEFLHILHKKKN